MIQTPKISIIVPIYKVERYLPECLDSIIRQTFTDWECILVDDGSPDNCGKICDEYAARDPRFRVIHQKNGGLSAARNSGISIAKAQYIGFVDSDDWIEAEMFQTLYNLIRQDDYDMAQVGIFNEYRGKSHRKQLVRTPIILDRRNTVRHLFF
ncbi:MAG: glycosyltransferase, partial [Muribaculaceae bacterium]|nr:glycosyltransferase [Muribaculaceae bacterium]